MKKVLILSRKDDRESYDQKQTYTEALAEIDTKCEYFVDEFEDLLFWYDGTSLKILLSDGVTDIGSFDTAFLIAWFKTKMLEDLALSVSLYLESKGVATINTEARFTRSRSKVSQYVTAALNGISITPFLFSLNSNVLEKAIAEKWEYGYPVIMKGVQSSRGNDNYLIEDEAKALELARDMNNSDGPWYVVQSYVPNDGDYRIIVMGDKVTTIIHRQAQSGTHLNNTSKGGVARMLGLDSIPLEVIEQSVKLSKLLRREITGVDMIRHRDTSQFYLLEINNMPQLATGSYVSEKLTQLDDYIASL